MPSKGSKDRKEEEEGEINVVKVGQREGEGGRAGDVDGATKPEHARPAGTWK